MNQLKHRLNIVQYIIKTRYSEIIKGEVSSAKALLQIARPLRNVMASMNQLKHRLNIVQYIIKTRYSEIIKGEVSSAKALLQIAGPPTRGPRHPPHAVISPG